MFSSIWNFLTDPLYHWYIYGFGILALSGVAAFYFPFKWVKAGLGGLLLLTGAFILGGREMHREMKKRCDEELSKEQQQYQWWWWK